MSAVEIADIKSRLDVVADAIRQQAVISERTATLGGELNTRHAHFAKKLDELVQSLAFNQEVIRLLTARVLKVETELKEIQT